MTDELTTIQVRKEDAAEIKRRFPELRSDAIRVMALLGRFEIIHAETVLPADADPDAQPVTFVAVSKE